MIASHSVQQTLAAKKKRKVFSTSNGLQHDVERACLWVSKFFCFISLLLHVSMAETQLSRLIVAPNVELCLQIFVLVVQHLNLNLLK